MSSPLPPRGRGAYQAFTLIELLTVIAIIGILAAITFSIAGGVKQRAAIQQARSELATLSTALEAYKRQYGDYPQIGGSAANSATAATASATDGPGILFNALVGKRGPLASPNAVLNSKTFIQLEKLTAQDTTASALPTNTATQVANSLLDPWGHRYLYFYKDGGTWKSPSYVLYSIGPDGLDTPPTDGIADYSDTKNVDNLYANR